jgi:cysteine desulfurase
MTASPLYLDHAATTPVRREVLEAMFPYFQSTFANPSSVHSAGLEAAAALEQARALVSDQLGCSQREIVFTSGGTEADNLAVVGAADARRRLGSHVVVSAVEHEAVLQSARELERRGFRVSHVPVDAAGLISPRRVAELVTPDTVLVSCMYANNEVGTIQPIAAIAAAVRGVNPDVVVHTDAVQAAGALPLDIDGLGVDLLSLSAHKIYGPRGVGALYIRAGVQLHPLIHGGGQESGLRSGTENVAGCVGFATALALAQSERRSESERLRWLRDRLIEGVLATTDTVQLTGHRTQRLPNHASFVFGDRTGESVLVDLDARGIMCSSGSACHAGLTDPSHVLLAMGFSDHLAHNGIRLTLGRDTEQEDVDRVLAELPTILGTEAAAGVR